MSLPWKSELRLRIGTRWCEAAVLSPWKRKALFSARVEAAGAQFVTGALKALRDQGADPLPTQARVLLEDELVYLARLPASLPWSRLREAAAEHFARALGRVDLRIDANALPGDGGWIAAAWEQPEHDALREELAAHGVRLVHAQPALLADLSAVAAQVPDDAIVVAPRDAGMTIVRVRGGGPTDLSWERCDMGEPASVDARVNAFRRLAAGDGEASVVVMVRSQGDAAAWQAMAARHQGKVVACQGSAAGEVTA